MINKEFDDKQQKYFDDMNSVGLGELILFSKSIVPFVEKESQRNKVLKVVTGICGYQTNAREFAKKISYEVWIGCAQMSRLSFSAMLESLNK